MVGLIGNWQKWLAIIVNIAKIISIYGTVTTMSQEFCLWRDILDLVGPATKWPRNIRRFFWSRHLKYWPRLQVAAFVWVNGLNPEVFFDWCFLRNIFQNGSEQHRHFQQLFRYFDEGRNYSLWAWNVSQNRYEFLDGTIRYRDQQRQQWMWLWKYFIYHPFKSVKEL